MPVCGRGLDFIAQAQIQSKFRYGSPVILDIPAEVMHRDGGIVGSAGSRTAGISRGGVVNHPEHELCESIPGGETGWAVRIRAAGEITRRVNRRLKQEVLIIFKLGAHKSEIQ